MPLPWLRHQQLVATIGARRGGSSGKLLRNQRVPPKTEDLQTKNTFLVEQFGRREAWWNCCQWRIRHIEAWGGIDIRSGYMLQWYGILWGLDVLQLVSEWCSRTNFLTTKRPKKVSTKQCGVTTFCVADNYDLPWEVAQVKCPPACCRTKVVFRSNASPNRWHAECQSQLFSWQARERTNSRSGCQKVESTSLLSVSICPSVWLYLQLPFLAFLVEICRNKIFWITMPAFSRHCRLVFLSTFRWGQSTGKLGGQRTRGSGRRDISRALSRIRMLLCSWGLHAFSYTSATYSCFCGSHPRKKMANRCEQDSCFRPHTFQDLGKADSATCLIAFHSKRLPNITKPSQTYIWYTKT